MQCVVAYDMPLVHHALHQFGRGVDIIAHDKKAGGRIVFFERIQNRRGVSVFVTRVKGQVDGLFVRVAQIVCAVLREFLHGSVADGRLAVCLEGQAPVGDGRGRGLCLCAGLRGGLLGRRQEEKQRGEQRTHAGARSDAVQDIAGNGDEHK